MQVSHLAQSVLKPLDRTQDLYKSALCKHYTICADSLPNKLHVKSSHQFNCTVLVNSTAACAKSDIIIMELSRVEEANPEH